MPNKSNSQPKEVFNYKEYLEFMESKKVRRTKSYRQNKRDIKQFKYL